MSKHVINRLDGSGHTQLAAYDIAVVEEVSLAEELFNSRVVEGTDIAFGVGENGQGKALLREFDQTYPEIILVSPLVGG